MAELRIAGGALLTEGKSRLFELLLDGRTREAFLLKHAGQLFAYLNECPHWAVDLDLGDGHFFDPAVDRIYCKNHGALFLPQTGVCETGPCLGRSLTSFALRLEGDDVVVQLP